MTRLVVTANTVAEARTKAENATGKMCRYDGEVLGLPGFHRFNVTCRTAPVRTEPIKGEDLPRYEKPFGTIANQKQEGFDFSNRVKVNNATVNEYGEVILALAPFVSLTNSGFWTQHGTFRVETLVQVAGGGFWDELQPYPINLHPAY